MPAHVSRGVFGVGGVHDDPAPKAGPMHIGHHRADVPGAERPPGGRVLLLIEKLLAVEISVEAGCVYKTSGFHIGGGVGLLPNVARSGYGLFQAVGVKLGKYLTDYLTAQGMVDEDGEEKFWSIFQFVKHDPHHALPEEWWEYAAAFFSMSQERIVPPITIPGGTELFTLQIKILEGTPEAQYTLTCEDEHYYTHARQRRRDFLFTANTDSPFASGGITDIETFPGLLRVRA